MHGYVDAMRRSSIRGRLAPALVALVVVVGACSDDSGESTASSTTVVPVESSPSTTSTTAVPRPEGPAADLSVELSGGDGVFVGASEERVLPDGWVQEEFAAAGTATSYVADGGQTPEGEWSLVEDETADYRTRIVVRRPESAAEFSGVVVVEWFNVSGGVDADPDYATMYEEILRQGHAYVGVSAQHTGIEGGNVLVAVDEVEGSEAAGLGLRAIDPERYGSLSHPGDAFSYDMYTQIARALRAGDALGGLAPSAVLAVGESQSAGTLVTYYNGVQPLTDAFDGFLVHSRGGFAHPIPAVGENPDLAASVGGTAIRFRTDLATPVMNVQMENDVVGVLASLGARQPDSDVFRLWEVPGTSHADLRLIGESMAESVDCGAAPNNGPQHIVIKAALRHLVDWVVAGEAPPEMPRLELDETGTDVARDVDGIALGGVRTPPVDVPVEVLSGAQGPASSSVMCILLGSTLPIPEDRLAELYESAADYEQQHAASVDAAIESGAVLADDREAVEAYAQPALVPG